MRYRVLAFFPIVAAAIFLVTTRGSPLSAAMQPQIEIAKVFDLVGCVIAAIAFGRGDYLRRAWALTGACAAVLLLRDAVLPIDLSARVIGIPLEAINGAMVLLANACAIGGLWMMARTWRLAGLEPPVSVRGRRTTVGAAIVAAVLVGASAIALDVRELARGDLAALVGMASDFGDVASILLIAPVALTAAGMQGGALRWPWGLLTASVVCWLGYDVAAVVRPLVSEAHVVKIAGETFRVMACTFTFAAGVAQSWSVRRKRRTGTGLAGALLLLFVAPASCNAIAGIEPGTLRDDAAGFDAPSDSSDDAAGEEPGDASCAVSADCTGTARVCNGGKCVAVAELGRGNGRHSCVLLTDGSVWCWGDNSSGAIGTGVAGSIVQTPTRVDLLPPDQRVTQVAAGTGHTCVRTTAGFIYCWGNTTAGGNSPGATQVYLPAKASSVSAGSTDSCAVLDDGRVYCWGDNTGGEMGCTAGTTGGDCASLTTAHPPAAVTSPRLLASSAKLVAVGGYTNCVVLADGNASCWGNGTSGELGGNAKTPGANCCGYEPKVVGPGQITSIEATELYVCARDGDLADWWCWGDNESCAILGQPCPDPFDDPVVPPVKLPLPSGLRLLAPGWRHGCATVGDDTQVQCWGQASEGEMGDGAFGTIYTKPHTVKNLSGKILDLASHRHFTCALQDDGEVVCWGNNEFGEMAAGDAPTNHPLPTSVQFP